MFATSVLLAWLLHHVAALPSPPSLPAGNSRRASVLQKTTDVVQLRKTTGVMPPSSKALWDIQGHATGQATTISIGNGVTYDALVQLGNQSFRLIWDTGSSELWVPSSTFQCYSVDKGHSPVPQSACSFGKLFEGTFGQGQIPDENLKIDYGFGGFVTGTYGYERVTFAGITLDHQEIALVNHAAWEGQAGVGSGVFGFAFPQLTSGYSGNDPSKDNNETAIKHNPWIFNVFAQKKIPPVFSLALERGADGGRGHVALGGLPDIDFDSDFVSTALEAKAITPQSQNTSNFTYYTVTPQGYTVDGCYTLTDFPFIVDSGSTFVNLPDTLAKHVNELFVPPAQFNEAQNAWEVDCTAKPPLFGVDIGGKTFYINPADMLVPNAVGQTPPSGKCLTGVQPSGSMPAFLGDVFLKNVVAVFDIGQSEMLFAAHEDY